MGAQKAVACVGENCTLDWTRENRKGHGIGGKTIPHWFWCSRTVTLKFYAQGHYLIRLHKRATIDSYKLKCHILLVGHTGVTLRSNDGRQAGRIRLFRTTHVFCWKKITLDPNPDWWKHSFHIRWMETKVSHWTCGDNKCHMRSVETQIRLGFCLNDQDWSSMLWTSCKLSWTWPEVGWIWVLEDWCRPSLKKGPDSIQLETNDSAFVQNWLWVRTVRVSNRFANHWAAFIGCTLVNLASDLMNTWFDVWRCGIGPKQKNQEFEKLPGTYTQKTCWLAGWLAVWLAGWLAGWLVGWLPAGWWLAAGWLAGWLAGCWLAGCLLAGWIIWIRIWKWMCFLKKWICFNVPADNAILTSGFKMSWQTSWFWKRIWNECVFLRNESIF